MSADIGSRIGGIGFNPLLNRPGPDLYHTVKKGDTINSIASQYQVEVRALLDANPNVRNLGRVQPGMAVVIPEKGK